MQKHNPVKYAGLELDRASAKRADPAWIQEKLEDDKTLTLPIWKNKSLFEDLAGGVFRPVFFERPTAGKIIEQAEATIFLGLDQDRAVFAALLSHLEENEATQVVGGGEFVELRKVTPYLKSSEAALMAYARGMDIWHATHRHCGTCGHPTEIYHGGHMRKCSNPDCGRKVFPRTDPAVIMLVENPDQNGEPKCLLGHHGRIPIKMYSTLAGFVEPGETLEEAVAREVFEEVGLDVENITYQASQPWPFPASIMLGFRARATTDKITIDPEELIDARWFSAAEVRKADQGTGSLVLSPRDSIARKLIRDWLQDVGA